MVTVPDYLKGATILDAHQWVVSNLDGRNEYVLRDMSGMETTLSDLTRGTVTEVNIAPAGVRANPAPSYVFKPEFQPQKRVQQFSSRVMLPDGISPSVVHALEAKHGAAYRFIASKMLSQRSRRQQLSPRGTRILSSFIMADPYAGVRSNPIGLRQTPSGIRMARIVGDRGRVMDDAVVAEVKGYLEGNELPFDIAASERQFNQFVKGVLQPYLISLRSNQALIKYLNETLLPHMLRLIDAGEFDADVTEIGFFRKAFKSAVEAKTALKSAAGKDKVKKILSDQYETVVRRLATSPQDFYYGRNEALVAHPAFMFPHAAAFLIPPPRRLTGGTRAEVFFYQAGEPPRYTTVDGKITQELPKRMLDKMPLKAKMEGNPYLRTPEMYEGKEYYNLPIARVNNAPIDYGNVMNVQSVQKALATGNVGQVILMASQAFANDGVLKRMFGLGAATPPSGLTEEEGNALLDLNKIVNMIQQQGPIEGFKTFSGGDPEEFPLAAAIEVNIGGIKPKPLGWPEGLIFAVMQVISENSDQIMQVGAGETGAKDFFQPNIEGIGPLTLQLTKPADLDAKLEKTKDQIKKMVVNYFDKGIMLSDLVRESDSRSTNDFKKAYAASLALHFANNGNVLEENMIASSSISDKDAETNFKDRTVRDPRKQFKNSDNRLSAFNSMTQNRASSPNKLGIMSILQLALTRFKQDGGQPTPEQVNFVAQLTLYSLQNLSTEFDAFGTTNLVDLLKETITDLQGESAKAREAQITNLISKLDESRAKIPEENVLQQIVEDRLLEDFFEELLTNNLEDVFDNPRRNPPLPKLSEIIGEGPKDTNALRRALSVLKKKNQENAAVLGASPFLPTEETVRRLADSMKGVFQAAQAEAKEAREEAEAAIKRDNDLADLLDSFKDVEVSVARTDSYMRLIQGIGKSLKALCRHELDFAKEFMLIPDNPNMELEDNLVRQEMFNHPLYIAQKLLGDHKMFMDNIQMVETSLRAGLSSARFQYRAEEGAWRQMKRKQEIEYLVSAIEFCNGLQDAYAEVGGSLGMAVDDMRVDDKDSISPHLYIALFDVTDNFVLRDNVRQALRALSTTSMRLVDPLTTKITFDELTKKSYDLVGEMFGGFPGDTSAINGKNPLVLGKAYLNKLVDADIDFSGSTIGADSDSQQRLNFIAEVTGAKYDLTRVTREPLSLIGIPGSSLSGLPRDDKQASSYARSIYAENLAREEAEKKREIRDAEAFEKALADKTDLAGVIAEAVRREAETIDKGVEALKEREQRLALEASAHQTIDNLNIDVDNLQRIVKMKSDELTEKDANISALEAKVDAIAQQKSKAEGRLRAQLDNVKRLQGREGGLRAKKNPNEHPFDTRYDMTHQDSNVDTTQGTSALSDEALARGYYAQQKKRMPKKSVKMVDCMRCGKPTFEDSLVENSFCQKCADALARTNPVVRWSV